MSANDPGSTFRTRSNQGLQHMVKREFAEAEEIFRELLDTLDEEPSFDRAMTLARVGSCRACLQRPGEAIEYFRGALDVQKALERNPAITQQEALLKAELGNALRLTGDYDGARVSYREALELFRTLNDPRNVISVSGRLGSLALFQRDFSTAETYYGEARDMARDLKEPEQQALAAHQLGMVFQATGRWVEAEHSYREAAALRESLNQTNGPGGAAVSWGNLAEVYSLSGRPDEAETWFRKALQAQQKEDDPEAARTLYKLSVLLRDRPGRRDDAREYAEKALELQRAHGAATPEICDTYDLLGDIAEEADRSDDAARYRLLGRKTRAKLPSAGVELRRYLPLIAAVVAFAHGHEAAAPVIAGEQGAMREAGDSWSRLADALDRIMAGSRNPALPDRLDSFSGLILETILQGIADPNSLEWLIEAPGAGHA